MKKMIAILIAVSLMLSLIGCVERREREGSDSTSQTEGVNESSSDIEETVTPIEYTASISRVGYSNNELIYSASLNKTQYGGHMPIYKCTTLEELERFKADFTGIFSMSYSTEAYPSFNEVTADLDVDFFESYTLLLVYVVAGSGSNRYAYNGLKVVANTCCVYVKINSSGSGPADMAGWLVTVPVLKDRLAGVEVFDATYGGYVEKE